MKIHYKLPVFEGPLDLLLHLIEKAEVDIYDIPIKEITDQYMEYLMSMREIDLEPTSEFLVMAATLLSIKSRMLLPKPPSVKEEAEEEEEDPRMELVRRLLEYRKFKEAAGQLREMEIAQSLVYSREPLDLTPFLPQARENPVRGLHIVDLLISFQKMMKQAARRNAVATIRRDEISVQDRIEEIVSILQFREEPLLFSDLLLTDWTREEVIVTFLAVLELMKMKRIQCYQHGLFDDIVIVYRGEGSGDDIISTVETGD